MSKFNIIVEETAYDGIKKIAEKVKKDFEKVTGSLPNSEENASGQKIVFATLGKSTLINYADFSELSGKWECYKIKFIDDTLYVVGSDKRGTIYGMFAVSEYIGVSPLHYFGDVEPKKNPKLKILPNIEQTSKEPSVKYRGLFINDEWPCFGNWTFGKFGGFNADMYDHVFELLLRLKGNYMWPAMWASRFPVDGPGLASYELADMYGVVMGASHHEPLLRAGEEYKHERGKDSKYGDAWNYYTNKEGIDLFWEDAIKERGHLESIITIGMRGEADTTMLGYNSTVEENIQLLKDVITQQKSIIHQFGLKKENQQMLAVYKEVEAFFWGGLKDWDGLNNTILMLCEDNFGFTRGLPTEELKDAGYKFGMYYHFDYHGGPISYEWVMSTQLERAWDQLTMAYDYGIRDIWIVNVGDLKFNEVQLAFFLDLAYDINTKVSPWLEKFTQQNFTSHQKEIADILQRHLKLNSIRRPEALNSSIFHPTHYNETDRMLKLVYGLLRDSETIYNKLVDDEKDAYYSMIHYPVLASMTNFKMHLYSTKNQALAFQGKKLANKFADRVQQKIKEDKALSDEFAAFKNGKWKGMELAPHIGFTIWNEDNNRMPTRTYVEPVDHPRLVVSKSTSRKVHYKTYGGPMVIDASEFLYAGNEKVIIEIANDGIGEINYLVHNDTDWVLVDKPKGTVAEQEDIIITVDRSKLDHNIKEATISVLMLDEQNRDKANPHTMNRVDIAVKARNPILPKKKKAHMQNAGVFVVEAHNYAINQKVDTEINEPAGFELIKNYGRSLEPNSGAMKVYPTTARFDPKEKNRPELQYILNIEEPGDYIAEVWSVPTNPVVFRGNMQFMLNKKVITAVDHTFDAGTPSHEPWANGVLNNIRKTKVNIKVKKAGLKAITIGAIDPNFILEKLVIYKVGSEPKESYLGPTTSYVIE